jgi:TPR repeat protein
VYDCATPTTIKITLGQKVRKVSIPGPIGFGLGSLVTHSHANRMTVNNGPLPKIHRINPIQNTRAPDVAEALKWYRRAADQGYAKAQYALGLDYYGGSGVPKDAAEAAKWFRKAAEQGYAMAQSYLGWCYAAGEGVPKDAAEGVKWYRRAAEQGFAEAQDRLGVCY